MEIRTAQEILKEWEFYQHTHDNSDMIKAMKEYANQFIDYASENVEADYTVIGIPDPNKSDALNFQEGIEVYIPKGEFDKIKELIK